MYDESCLPRIGSNIRLLRVPVSSTSSSLPNVSASVRPI